MLGFFYIAILLLIIVLCFLVYIVFRYDARVSVLAVLIGLLLALINVQIVRIYFLPNLDDYEYDEGAIFPAEPWREILTLDDGEGEFEFRPEQGLFLKSETAELQIRNGIPGCLEEDGIAQSYQSNPSRQSINSTNSPIIELPPPPGTPLQKISFNIPIQDQPEVDNVILGASAFAVFSNGEVWCTEREVQRGQTVGLGIGLALGFKNLMIIVATFLSSFLVVELGVIGLAQFRMRKH